MSARVTKVLVRGGLAIVAVGGVLAARAFMAPPSGAGAVAALHAETVPQFGIPDINGPKRAAQRAASTRTCARMGRPARSTRSP